MQPIKKVLSKILFALYIILFSCIVLEMSIRFMHLAPKIPRGRNLYQSDKYLPYITLPSITRNVDLENAESTFLCKHNKSGLRDVEHITDKKKGVFRIIGLGDSFTYGFGASFEDTYLFKLEKMLNNRKGIRSKIEIIKAGIPASYPETERMFLAAYGIEYKPDLVIIGFLPNDVVNTYTGLNYYKVTEDNYLTVFNNNVFEKACRLLYYNSHFFRLILTKFYWSISSHSFEHWADIYKESGFHERNWQKIEDEYSKMREICNRINAKLVIIHIPERVLPAGVAERTYPAERLAVWCRNHNAYFIDILPVFEKSGNFDSFYWKEGHCNPKGYELIAETVYSKLIEGRLVP